MSWKSTALLAALLGVALAVYLISPGPGAVVPEDPRLLPHVAPDTLVRLEIARKGEASFVIERGRDAAGEHWRVGTTVVDDPALREMISAFDRFRSTGALDPGSPEAAPAITGLEAPRLAVTFQSTTGRDTLRFGKAPPSNSNAVFFTKDGDSRVFLADATAVASFDKTAGQLRERRLLRYAPHTIARFVLRHAFTVARGKDPKVVETEIEESVVERVVSGSEKGWFLVKPHREKLDDLRVQRLVSELAAMPVNEFRPAGDAKAQGLEPPRVEVELYPAGVETPVVVRFGAVLEDNRRRPAQLSGVPDWALIEERRFEDLPTQRKHLRSDAIFPFTKEQVKTFAVRAGEGRLRIERREIRKEGDPLPAVVWELAEPKGLRINQDKLEPYVASFLYQRVTDFLGAQPELRMFGLDAPAVELDVELKDGAKHAFRFGATANNAYLKREGLEEVFAVQPDLVKLLRRLELSLLHEEIYNVPITSLREFTFEAKMPGALEPLFYTLRRTSGGKGWEFADPKNAGKVPNPGWAHDLAVLINFIKADEGVFLGRDDETSARLGLGEAQAPARLRIKADAEPGDVEFLISDNQSEKAGRRLYYARMKGSPVVFKLGTTLVEALKDVRLAKD